MRTIKTSVGIIALLMSSTTLYAQTNTDTRSVSASVAGALQGDTGFLTGGQVQVSGVGQGSVTLARGNAAINVAAGASASLDVAPSNYGLSTSGTVASPVPQSSSSMITTFDFNRDVNTAGALVGIGNMVAQGESIGGVAVVGSANSNATRAGTGGTSSAPTSGSSSTPTTAQGSLVGNFSTANTMQLVGTGALFAGSQALNVGERNTGAAAGRTGTVTADAEAINLNTLAFGEVGPTYTNKFYVTNAQGKLLDADGEVVRGTPTGGSTVTDLTLENYAGATLATGSGTPVLLANNNYAPAAVTGNGAGFISRSSLNGGSGGTNGTIEMNVANAGQGTVNISASTGGFFGQGTTFGATAAPTFSQTGTFFTPRGGSGGNL